MSNTDEKWKQMQEARLNADNELLQAIKTKLPELEKLYADIMDHWVYEDFVYRFYHHSFKVYYTQEATKQMVTALKALRPGQEINKDFDKIFQEGTSTSFTLADNDRWLEATRPIIEAFFHAKYFLEMAIKYGKEMDKATGSLPSGWAAFLYFYNMR